MCKHKSLLVSMLQGVLLLLQFNNFDWNMELISSILDDIKRKQNIPSQMRLAETNIQACSIGVSLLEPPVLTHSWYA